MAVFGIVSKIGCNKNGRLRMTLISSPIEIWRELFSLLIFIAIIDLYVYFFSWWVDTIPESSNWD